MGQVGSTQFPYDIGEEVFSYSGQTSWKLYKATSKTDKSAVSIFQFDIKSNSESRLESAQNAIQRLKTLRHPNILRFINAAELPDKVYVVTEACEPLDLRLLGSDSPESESYVALGLHQLMSTVSFLNNDCKVVHGNICPSSLFVTKSGDWKLGGFDLAWAYKDGVPYAVKNNSHIVPDVYRPARKSWSDVEREPIWATDAWMLGCFIYAVFNPNFRSQEQLGNIGNIPEKLRAVYGKLLANSPRQRINAKDALSSPFFSNPLVQSVDFLEKLLLKSEDEKLVFFMGLSKAVKVLKAHPLQERVLKYKILPNLTKAMEFGGAEQSFSHVLSAALQIGSLLNEADFTEMVAPSVKKLFASNQRAVRVQLLQNLDAYAGNLTKSVVNDIWPNLKSGFADKTPQLRELSLKALVSLVPKLDTSIVDTEVMRFLAKLQTDPQAAIRTNTTYCLGKIATHLRKETQQKVLASAYCRALQDPFPPSRMAGIACLAATVDLFSPVDVAKKIVPTLSAACIDPEKQVRNVALRALSKFCHQLQKISDTMPEHAKTAEEIEAEKAASGGNQTVNKAKGMIGKVGNWAVSSLSKKLYGGDDKTNNASSSTTSTGSASQGSASRSSAVPAAGGSKQAGSMNPNSSSTSGNRNMSSTKGNGSYGAGGRNTHTKTQKKTSGVSDGWDDDFMDFDEDNDDEDNDDDGIGGSGSDPISLLTTTKKPASTAPKKTQPNKTRQVVRKSSTRANTTGNQSRNSKAKNDDPFALLDSFGDDNGGTMAESKSGQTTSNDWDAWNDLGGLDNNNNNSNNNNNNTATNNVNDPFGSFGTTTITTTSASLSGGAMDDDPFGDLMGSSGGGSSTTNKPSSSNAFGGGDDDWGSLLGATPSNTHSTAAKPAATSGPMKVQKKKGADADDWAAFLNT